MRILVACEFSAVVRDAFRKLGHDAYSCDIVPSEGDAKYHIQGDALEILDGGWDLMIAHPPCTYLSRVATRHLYKNGVLNEKRYKMGVEAKDFFMKLYNADIPRIAVENPVPFKIFELPKYSQIVQPYYFGEPMTKATCLWLKNLPLLKPTNMVVPGLRCEVAGSWYSVGGKDRQKKRSRTFDGIAQAMAEQWGKL